MYSHICVAEHYIIIINVRSLTPSLVKNSKAACSRFLADSISVPSFQGRWRVGNPKGSAPKIIKK